MSLVDIKPDVLQYTSPLTEQSTEFATISNNSNETIAFKVKTTAPKYYCVRPNAAVVAPGETVPIQVIFLGLPEEPQQDFKCRDKFLVITLPAPIDLGSKTVAEAWSELEAQYGKDAVSKKIKVKYVIKSKDELLKNDSLNSTNNNNDININNNSSTIDTEKTNNSTVIDTTGADDITKDIQQDQILEKRDTTNNKKIDNDNKKSIIEIDDEVNDEFEKNEVEQKIINERIQAEKSDIEPTKETTTANNSSFNFINLIVVFLIAFLIKWLFF